MKFRKFGLLLLILFAINIGSVLAQQSQKPKRPVKNPPQYPNIIDLENKTQKPPVEQEKNKQDEKQAPTTMVDPNALTKAFTIIAEELKSLSQEVKTLNLRQEMQLELMRQTRLEQRIDRYEAELRPIRERLAGLEAEELRLPQLMTRDALLMQTAQTATVNREGTMDQIRAQLAARLQMVQEEKERLLKVQAAQTESLGIYQKLSSESEQRIQQAEEKLRQLGADKPDRNP